MFRARGLIGALLALSSVLAPACDPSDIDRLPVVTTMSRCRGEGRFARSTTMVVRCTRSRWRDVVPADLARGAAAATRPAQPGRVRVMVAGDSFAMSLVPGLRRSGDATGTIDVISGGLVGCGVGRGGRNRGIGLDREWPPECRLRDPYLRALIRIGRPNLVVVAGGMWDVTDRQLPGDPTWRSVGDPTYDLFMVGEIIQLVDLLRSEGVRVAWATAPHWNPVHVPTLFMGPPPYPEADPARTDRLNELLRLALVHRPEVAVIDLAARVQSLPGGEFGPGMRNDGVHLTDAGSDQIAAWLGPELVAAATRSG